MLTDGEKRGIVSLFVATWWFMGAVAYKITEGIDIGLYALCVLAVIQGFIGVWQLDR